MRSPLLPIFLIVAVDVLGLTIMIPLLPFYAERFGASPAMVGWLIGVYAACQLVSGPLLGRASDFTGRKPLLIVSQIGTLIGFLMLAFAPNLWIIFLARVVDGATAGNLSLAQAYISDVTEPEQRSKAFGLIGIAFGMGFLIGPAISG
ncbi:MAG TPA: MFS transporter, partial [Bryobacteraceae bacterium]|nr:MFS transporter [Bryobacteraceae bacterium]